MPIEEQAAADLRQLKALANAVITAAQNRTGQVERLNKQHSELYEAIRTKIKDAAYAVAFRQAWANSQHPQRSASR